jgi:hypothetical protein
MADDEQTTAPAESSRATSTTEDPHKPSELTARIAAFPSEVLAPIPSFIFAVPENWVVDDAPNALGQVRTETAVDGFYPNVLITHTRMGRGFDLEAAAALTWQAIQNDPAVESAEVKSEQVVRFGDVLMYVRSAEIHPAGDSAESDPIFQMHGMCFAPVRDTGQTCDFFQLLCSSKLDQGDRALPYFLHVMGSFRFT